MAIGSNPAGDFFELAAVKAFTKAALEHFRYIGADAGAVHSLAQATIAELRPPSN
jgi:hypothetical protein